MTMKHVLVWVTPAYPPRLNGIARYARAHGWYLTIEDRIAHRPVGWQGNGALVTIRDDPAMIQFVKSLRRRRIPVVDLTFNHPELRLPRVSGDHVALGRVAAEHFAARNFRHAAWFSSGWLNIHRLRYEGFASAWPGEPPTRWVAAELLPADRRDDLRVLARTLADRLAAAPKPLAVLAYDDADAARLLTVCRTARLAVPEEIAILGIGGDELVCENQEVPLSSVAHDQERTGFEGAALLDRLMDGADAPPQPILIPPAGVITRASTDFLAVKSPVLRRALAHIEANLSRPVGIEQVAAAVGIPRRTLERLFQDELGRSCGKEILRRRFAHARILLRNKSLSIQQIADACGFCNQAYFSNQFRAAFGQSPRLWRTRPA